MKKTNPNHNKRGNTRGAFGSSVNNHVLHDLRKKLTMSQIVIMALIDKFGITQEQMNGIVRDHLRRQHLASGNSGINPSGSLPDESTTASTDSE